MRCIFCEFINGKRKKHADGLPFMIINNTKNTLSFLSNVIPETVDGQVIIIPKKHYSRASDIPSFIIKELIEHSFLLVKVIETYNDGCNILLNDGKYAGQTIPHSHFHIIPRNRGDNIRLESYKTRKMSSTEFLNLHTKIKKMLNE